MTTVILTCFNLEFYFGTQFFVISGVNYLRSHKKGHVTVTSQTLIWAQNGISNS